MARDFEIERSATRDEAAAVLRAVADGVAGGALRLGEGDDAVAVDVPDGLALEIEFETEDGDRSLEIELEWPRSAGEEDDAVETTAGDAPTGESDLLALVGATEQPESLARFELFRDRSDEWRWRLVHRNGNVIADSGEGYTRKHGARKGLRSVARNAPGAEVVEEPDA